MAQQSSVPTRVASSHLSSEYYRKQAKSLLKSARTADPASLERFRSSTPRMMSAIGPDSSAGLTLADAQFVVARENGFASWPKLKARLAAANGASGRCRPFVNEVGYYEERAGGLLSTHKTGMRRTLRLIQASHPRFRRSSLDEIASAELTLDDALLITARQHGFEDWAALARHIQAMAAGSVTEPFAEAFEAIKSGDREGLARVLAAHPDLVNAYGTNGNTLLNLAASFRRTDMTRMLIAAGADVDLANFKGWTPLHQAAYSNQAELARLLLDAGASTDMEAYGEGGTPLMQALFWGHRETAELLAQYGIVPANLRAAAGAGRLDLVREMFNADGSLTREAGLRREYHRPHSGFPPWRPGGSRQEIVDEAFVYAAKSGRIAVMEFLLEQGAGIDGEPYNGTALQWSLQHKEAAVWLLDHGADVNRRAAFGGVTGITPLITAAWGGRTEMVALLLSRGADVTLRDPVYHGSAPGWAEHHEHAETRDYLLEHAPLDLFDAIRFKRPDRVGHLLAADPDSANRPLFEPEHPRDSDAPLPIYRAIRSGSAEILRLLLEHGADLNPALLDRGQTPLQVAQEGNDTEKIALLQQFGAR